MMLSKKSVLTFVILVTSILVYSQDLIYSVQGEYNSSSLALDSILIENLSNGTMILFGNLPIQTNYEINLSTKEVEIQTDIDIYQIDNHLSVVKNIPGNICLSIKSNKLQHARVLVYNMQGQILWTTRELQIESGNFIDVQLPGGAIYIVKVATDFGVKAYRAAGSMTTGSIQVSIDGKGINDHGTLKSATSSTLSDFSFQTGDDLRVTAFREGYYTRPAEFEIDGSRPIEFLFDLSRVEIDGISDVYVSIADVSDIPNEYDLATGEVKIDATDETRKLIKGDIITVDADTAGYLRKVVSVTEEDGKVVLETEQAFMDELFVDKAFKLSTIMIEPSATLKSTSSLAEITSALTDEQGYIHPVKVILYNSEGEAIMQSAKGFKSSTDEIRKHIVDEVLDFSMTDLYGEEGDNVHFYISEGTLSFKTDAVFEFDFDYQGEFTEDTKVKKGDLKLFEFYLEATSGVHTKLELDMSKSLDKEDDPEHLFKIAQARAQFVVPPGVPVWIDFDLDMYRAIILHADASLHADWGFEINDTLKVGGRYTRETKELEPISEFKHHTEIFPLNLEGEINASARLELFPRMEMKLYSIFGPYAEIVPFVEGNYNAYGQVQLTPLGSESFLAWNAGLDLGLDLRVGTTLKLWKFERDFGPKVIHFSEKPLPLWRSPYSIELLTELPDEVSPGATLSLQYKVTDMRGSPVAVCPVYLEGDGTFNQYLILSNLNGEVTIDWTLGEIEEKYEVNAMIFNADKSIADNSFESVVIVKNGGGESIIDIDGNTYSTIQIGNQLWMAENLRTTRFADGTAIPMIQSNSAWEALTTDSKAYCWYNNSTSNRDTYGGLYTWAAAMNGSGSSSTNPSGIQGVCPDGWHLPSDAEWKELELQLGMSQSEADETGMRGTNEGGKLKETGTTHWNSPNTGATNSSGFAALPGGLRFNVTINEESFYWAGNHTYFWTATEGLDSKSYDRHVSYNTGELGRLNYNKNMGYSVRCIQD